MKTNYLRLFAGLLILFLLNVAIATANETSSNIEPKRKGTHIWIERPWEMKYFLKFETLDSWKRTKAFAITKNAESNQKYFKWEEFFDPRTTIRLKPSDFSGEQGFKILLIDFNEQGFVESENTHPSRLRGRLNQLRYLTLSSGDDRLDRQYRLSEWFTGIGDASTDWAPGFCGLKESPSPFSRTDTSYLYGPKFEINEFGATFGCREWAYQLYNDERPYIDVTSYIREGKVYPKYTYIREFIGWARFGDKKPVIGKHEKDWYCLHDCPNDEQPGLIPNIKTWASKNGWSVPKPPTKAPTFLDPPAKSGTYPR